MPRVKHNLSGTAEYIAWRNMHRRCSNPADDSYFNYGGRGIRVCDRWNDPHQFLIDMGLRPDGFQLDRIDPNGDYTPENCRWASVKTQANNRRNTVRIRFDGQSRPLAEVADITGIKLSTLWARVVRRKMPPTRAVRPGSLRKSRSHGTRHSYEMGCRCGDCRAAHAAHHRARRAKRKAEAARALRGKDISR